MNLTKEQIQEIDRIRKHLIHFIYKRRNLDRYYTTYGQLVIDCKLPYVNLQRSPQNRYKLGVVLAELLKLELQYGRPPLTSIIYGVGLYRPRNGFYKTLININYPGTKGKTKEQLYENIKWRRGLERETVDFWIISDNYMIYK